MKTIFAYASRLLVLVCLFGALSQAARAQFGMPNPAGDNKPRATFEERTVLLGDIFPTLKVLQGVPNIDAIGETVKYKTVGKANYDEIFKEAAEINARTKQTKFLVGKYGKDPASFGANAAKGLGDKASDITDFKKLLPMLLQSLNKDNGRVADLLKRLSGLKPQDDFSALDVNGVIAAINQAKTNLEETAADAPKLIEEIGKLTK
jgi:hypothetical protein